MFCWARQSTFSVTANFVSYRKGLLLLINGTIRNGTKYSTIEVRVSFFSIFKAIIFNVSRRVYTAIVLIFKRYLENNQNNHLEMFLTDISFLRPPCLQLEIKITDLFYFSFIRMGVKNSINFLASALGNDVGFFFLLQYTSYFSPTRKWTSIKPLKIKYVFS